MAAPEDEKTSAQLNLIGWSWLLHGCLLILSAPLLAATRSMLGLIEGDLLAHLPPPERAQIEHLQQLIQALAAAIPWMLLLGALVLPPAIAFMRRAHWGRWSVEFLTWLHLLLVFPLLGWWTLQLPPVMLHFGADGQPTEFFRLLSHASHLLSVTAMAALAVYLLILIRRPQIRAAFSHPGGSARLSTRAVDNVEKVEV